MIICSTWMRRNRVVWPSSWIPFIIMFSFIIILFTFLRGCRGRDRMVVLQLPMQSVPITTNVVSLNPTRGRMYSIQHNVIYIITCQKFMVMVLNANFNNISVILWQWVLFVEETWVPRENHQPVTSHWQTLSHNVVSSTNMVYYVYLV
jgi:hypothetical protein